MSREVKCPMCGNSVPQERPNQDYDVVGRQDETCGPYYVTYGDLRHLPSEPPCSGRLCALLKERNLRGEEMPFILFEDEAPPGFAEGVPVKAEELLRSWPKTVPERINRSFCCLGYAAGQGELAGRTTEFNQDNWKQFLPFAMDIDEYIYFVKAIMKYGWISATGQTNPYKGEITPSGWAKFHELTGIGADRRNPVFVAMWFGRPERESGPDRSKEMSDLFDKSIRPACVEAGWDAIWAGMREHNEPIMDRIIADIRKAPFLVADLTNNNQGVYYEAGLAFGLGREVIFCCRQGKEVHFDVTGINRVVYETPDQLRKRLLNRILKTMKEGPFL